MFLLQEKYCRYALAAGSSYKTAAISARTKSAKRRSGSEVSSQHAIGFELRFLLALLSKGALAEHA
jgi:hypothetical protein